LPGRELVEELLGYHSGLLAQFRNGGTLPKRRFTEGSDDQYIGNFRSVRRNGIAALGCLYPQGQRVERK
jgi:hypothetical protein